MVLPRSPASQETHITGGGAAVAWTTPERLGEWRAGSPCAPVGPWIPRPRPRGRREMAAAPSAPCDARDVRGGATGAGRDCGDGPAGAAGHDGGRRGDCARGPRLRRGMETRRRDRRGKRPQSRPGEVKSGRLSSGLCVSEGGTIGWTAGFCTAPAALLKSRAESSLCGPVAAERVAGPIIRELPSLGDGNSTDGSLQNLEMVVMEILCYG